MGDSDRLNELEEQFSIDNRQLDRMSYRVKGVLDWIEEEDSVLDIGCVTHSATVAKSDLWLHGRLVNKAESVLGIDYAETEVQKLQQAGYNIQHENAEDFQLEDKYNKIVAGELIEHLSNPGSFLESVKKHLKNDGEFILTTPNPWTLERITAAIITGGIAPNPDHVCWYDKFTIESLLSRHSFQIEEILFYRPGKPSLRLSYRFFRNTILGLVHRIGFNQLGGGGMLIKATL